MVKRAHRFFAHVGEEALTKHKAWIVNTPYDRQKTKRNVPCCLADTDAGCVALTTNAHQQEMVKNKRAPVCSPMLDREFVACTSLMEGQEQTDLLFFFLVPHWPEDKVFFFLPSMQYIGEWAIHGGEVRSTHALHRIRAYNVFFFVVALLCLSLCCFALPCIDVSNALWMHNHTTKQPDSYIDTKSKAKKKYQQRKTSSHGLPWRDGLNGNLGWTLGSLSK